MIYISSLEFMKVKTIARDRKIIRELCDKISGETLSGIVTEFLYKVYPRPEVKPHQKHKEYVGIISQTFCPIWDYTEGSANCDSSDTRLCPRLSAFGARSSGNQEIPLQVQTLYEHYCTPLNTIFLSAYTTRRYTDGVWPYNLLPYGLPYVSWFQSTLFWIPTCCRNL